MKQSLFFFKFWQASYFRTYRPVAFKMMMYYFDKLALCKGQVCVP
ncbi:hypothetical protein P9Z72_07625 [Glaesserella parasuis]|nr:hypothetical protein [Glaesserella parasuis]MDG6312390.1 hypothetical protein [Glaesserella parasuis]